MTSPITSIGWSKNFIAPSKSELAIFFLITDELTNSPSSVTGGNSVTFIL